jgi:hypothetical protein
MKKFIAGLSALALAGMITMSVSADTTIAPDPDNMPAPKPGSAGLEVSYDVSPTYTVTIPAAVELSPTETQTKNITATDVKLEQGAKIVVTLDSASNTESGSTFNAKIGDSTATYSISAGGANIEVGGKVAEFDTKDGEQSAALTFSKAEGATYAGKHTEQLTFGIAVEDAAAEPAASSALAPLMNNGAVMVVEFEIDYDGNIVTEQYEIVNSNGTFEISKAISSAYGDLTDAVKSLISFTEENGVISMQSGNAILFDTVNDKVISTLFADSASLAKLTVNGIDVTDKLTVVSE